MATSGSIAGQEINGQKAYLFWSYTQDIPTRKTTITFTLKVKRVTSTYSTYKNNCNAYIEAPNGTDIYNQSTYDYDITSIGVGSYLTICSASKTFTHNTAGVLADVTCDSGIDLAGTSVGEYLNAAGTIEVANIPVGSKILDLWPNGIEIADVITMNVTDVANPAYVHDITYAFGSASGTVVNDLPYATGHDWTVPASLASQIPNAASGTIVFTCKTYSGATLIGTTTLSKTLKVPTSLGATISNMTATPSSDAIAQAWGKFIQGKTKATIAWTGAAGQYGATLVSWKLTATGHSYSGTSSASSGSKETTVLTHVGALQFTLELTDSRGIKTLHYVTVTTLAYAAPVITSFTARRGTGGVADEDGTQLLVKGVYSFSSCGGSNALTAQKTNSRQLPSGSFGADNTVATNVEEVHPGTFAVDYGYEAKLTITDAYGSVTALATIQPSFSLVDYYGATGKGIAFGEKATADGFWVNLAATFKQGIKVLGRLATYFSTASGDCNNITDEWHLGGNGSANYPIVGSTIWWYVNTIFYSSTTGGAKQIAYGYNGTHKGRVFTRNMYQGTWDTTWVEEMNTAGAGLAIKGLGQITSANLQATDNFLMGDVSDSDLPKRTELQSIAAYICRTVAVTMTRNTTNTTAATGSCKYFPELGIVVFNYRFTCAAFTAAAAKVLGNIGATYAPTVSTAIQAIHGTTANSCSVYIDGTGDINFKNEAAVAAGDNVYLMGVWQV